MSSENCDGSVWKSNTIERTRPLIIKQQFACALVLTNVIILCGFQGLSSQIACRAVTLLLQYSVTSCFGWVLMNARYLFTCIKKDVLTLSILKLSLLAWGCPLPFLVIGVIIGRSVKHKFGARAYVCWKSDHIIWALVVPCFLLITAALYYLLMVTHAVYVKKQLNRKTRKKRHSVEVILYALKTDAVMLLLTIIIWIFGCNIFWYPEAMNYHLIFGLGTGVQGLFLFFFCCIFCLEEKPMKRDSFVMKVSHGSIEPNQFNLQAITVTSPTSLGTPSVKGSYGLVPNTLTTLKETKTIVHYSEIITIDNQSKSPSTSIGFANYTFDEVDDAVKQKHVNETPNKIDRKMDNLNTDFARTSYTNSFAGSDFYSEAYSRYINVEARSISATSIANIPTASSVMNHLNQRISKSSDASHASRMGMNELETLFNNPNLMNQRVSRRNWSVEGIETDSLKKRTPTRKCDYLPTEKAISAEVIRKSPDEVEENSQNNRELTSRHKQNEEIINKGDTIQKVDLYTKAEKQKTPKTSSNSSLKHIETEVRINEPHCNSYLTKLNEKANTSKISKEIIRNENGALISNEN